jgi:hypothetical protein
MAEEQGFEVIDKRRVKADASPEEPAPAPAEEGSTEAGSDTLQAGMTDEELRAAMEEAAAMGAGGAAEMGFEPSAEAPPLDLPTALGFCVNMLNEVAWMKMGLIPNPLTGKVERDLTQAKAAIDSVGDLIPRLEPFIPEPQRRDLQVMLSNLRINFVQQNQKG